MTTEAKVRTSTPPTIEDKFRGLLLDANAGHIFYHNRPYSTTLMTATYENNSGRLNLPPRPNESFSLWVTENRIDPEKDIFWAGKVRVIEKYTFYDDDNLLISTGEPLSITPKFMPHPLRVLHPHVESDSYRWNMNGLTTFIIDPFIAPFVKEQLYKFLTESR